MIPKKRIRLSAMQRVEVWRRWKAGESLHAIGRALGKNNVVIHLLLKRHGGIAPPDIYFGTSAYAHKPQDLAS